MPGEPNMTDSELRVWTRWAEQRQLRAALQLPTPAYLAALAREARNA